MLEFSLQCQRSTHLSAIIARPLGISTQQSLRESEGRAGGSCAFSTSWRMEFWKTCQALHSEGLSSQRLKLWKKPARGPGCSSYRANPFVPLLLIYLDEFQTFLLALRLSPALLIWQRMKNDIFLLSLLSFLGLFFKKRASQFSTPNSLLQRVTS